MFVTFARSAARYSWARAAKSDDENAHAADTATTGHFRRCGTARIQSARLPELRRGTGHGKRRQIVLRNLGLLDKLPRNWTLHLC